MDRDKTNWLKGIALFNVIFLHYIGKFVTVKGWSFGMLTFFFVMSGYGIYHSLKKNNNIIRFYFNRALRIYPLYWIALAIYSLIKGKIFSFGVIFAVPFFIVAPMHLWFIT
ncbi:MAG: acyltransferase family protein [Deltaproteobacteria bacterium]|uniref:Acyltransferase family protein n=1 Tax=Candidatus Zymogenus saltonus TaxID=2844893 RepID=A0A9D8KBU0_9DELT|nr:acyltransferase family protein [Candidatus Zymogenus saltonus]